MSYQEALKRIQAAKENEATKLNLSKLKLKEIPVELEDVRQLVELSLSNNQITEIKRLDQLINLKWLSLDDNQIMEIKGLDQLSKLMSLSLHNNQIVEIKGLDQMVKLTSLDLSSNQITEIKGLDRLVKLVSLSLDYNQITEVKGLNQLIKLTSLSLHGNQIIEIKGLNQLIKLIELWLSSNQIREIQGLGELTKLTELYMSNNQIMEIRGLDQLVRLKTLSLFSNQIKEIKGLDQLVNLTSLELDSNQIKEIKGLDQLVKLTSIELSGNQIKEIKGLGQLIKLTELELSGNRIKEIEGMDQLISLKSLGLGSNQIKEIKGLTYLVNLTEFGVYNNQIEEIKGLDHLINLTSLGFDSNQIEEIKGLDHLVNLTGLGLDNNKIKEIKGLNQLTKLTELALDRNEIELLPPYLLQLKPSIIFDKYENHNKEGIYIGNNPFNQPPIKIVEGGKTAILQYYKQLNAQGKETIHEAKIMIVGEPGCGKTTLMKKLFNRDYIVPNKKEKSTVGIVVRQNWPIKLEKAEETITYHGHIWDFGGQQIQYMLHQFFLTTDCVYVLMANKRKEFTNFDYWLNVIQIMGKNSPLIILFNEINIGAAGGADYIFDQKRYQEAFPNLQLKEPFKVNFADKADKRFDVLVDTIQKNLISLNHVGHIVPANWLKVRDAVTLKRDKRYISIDAFFEICETYGIHQESFQKQILRYFHLLGIVLHFDQDPNLEDTIFLDPNWTVDALYSILAHKKIVERNGMFQRQEVNAIWQKKGYKQGDRSKLFRLMLKNNFDLCYELEGKNEEYILPILLPKVQPEYDWDDQDCLQFRYQYKFRPKGIVSRFIVRMHQYIDGPKVWQEGVVLKKGKVQAQIREAETQKEGIKIIDISVTGNPHDRKDFLALIREDIERIQNKAFPNLDYQQMVPCYCPDCQQSKDKDFFEYELLKKYLSLKRYQIDCKKSPNLNRVNVMKLLGNVYGPDVSAIQKLINDGKVKEALKQMEQMEGLFDNDLLKEVRVQFSRFSHTKKMSDQGLMKGEDGMVERNRVARVLLDILEQMK